MEIIRVNKKAIIKVRKREILKQFCGKALTSKQGSLISKIGNLVK
jgi:hypothetical protein